MKLTRVAVLALLSIITIFAVACGSSSNNSPTPTPTPTPYHTYHINETFNMTLKDPSDGGLTLICDYDHSMLELVDFRLLPQQCGSPPTPGCTPDDMWTFKAIKVGDTIITMNYVSVSGHVVDRNDIYPISVVR